MKLKLFLFYYKADLCPAGVGGIEENMGGFLSSYQVLLPSSELGLGTGFEGTLLGFHWRLWEARRAFVFVCARGVGGAASIFFTMPSEMRGCPPR